jgi:cytochrome c-type biogenesis protein
MELSIGLAVIAGLVSFISPCVLPLVPAYIGYMSGRMTNTVSASVGNNIVTESTPLSIRFSTVLHSVFFVAGFTFVFVSIGLLSTAFIQQIGGENINAVTSIIGRVGGIIIIFFGLHFMGTLPDIFARLRKQEALLDSISFSLLMAIFGSVFIIWGFSGTLTPWSSASVQSSAWLLAIIIVLETLFILWLVLNGAINRPGELWNNTLNRIEFALYSDTRKHLKASNNQGYAGSAIMGVVFSAGWTPCIGPVYGAVLTMAANGGSISQAGLLLTAYSLGLGIPFILTALTLDSAQGTLRKVSRHMNRIKLASGGFLILIGLAVASGQLQNLSTQFAGDFADFSISVEESVLGLVTGQDTENLSISSSQTINDSIVAADDNAIGLEVGNIAPDFQTLTDSGEIISLSDYRGQVVLLNFWATWCGPCRVEMPDFQTQYENHVDEGFVVLAVNNGERLEDVIDFREEFALTFPLLMDESASINDMYGLFSYPSTFLIDQNGIIIRRHFGALTEDQIAELVDELLNS